MVTAASYAAIVGRNSDDVGVLCRVIAANLGKEERGFFPGTPFLLPVTTGSYDTQIDDVAYPMSFPLPFWVCSL
jgi:hypothetical protein